MTTFTETEMKIYALIVRGAKDTPAIMARTGNARRTVSMAVRKLIDNGMVTAEGTGRATTYKANGEGA